MIDTYNFDEIDTGGSKIVHPTGKKDRLRVVDLVTSEIPDARRHLTSPLRLLCVNTVDACRNSIHRDEWHRADGSRAKRASVAIAPDIMSHVSAFE